MVDEFDIHLSFHVLCQGQSKRPAYWLKNYLSSCSMTPAECRNKWCMVWTWQTPKFIGKDEVIQPSRSRHSTPRRRAHEIPQSPRNSESGLYHSLIIILSVMNPSLVSDKFLAIAKPLRNRWPVRWGIHRSSVCGGSNSTYLAVWTKGSFAGVDEWEVLGCLFDNAFFLNVVSSLLLDIVGVSWRNAEF